MLQRTELQNLTAERKFHNVNDLVDFGTVYTHEEFMSELMFQDDNRRDFLFSPNEGKFVGTKFMIGDSVFPLDPVSLITLSERFKVSGRQTLTRIGLMELSDDQSIFEQTANFFLHRINKSIQFRTLVDVGIAFPSKEYTIVNNIDLISLILETINDIVGSSPTTKKHYLQKQLMYCFVPIDGVNLQFQTAEGKDEELQLGLEVRNSEILQNAISVAFKIIRKSTNEGILLTSDIKHVYHRHIGTTTNGLLNSVRQQLVDMFSSEAIMDAVSTMELIKVLMQTPIGDNSIVEDFVSLTSLNADDKKLLLHLSSLQRSASLYNRTLGAYYKFISSNTTNREKIEEHERISGEIIRSQRFRNLVS